MDVLGIQRNKKFSPNHIGNDEAIFALTAQALKQRGCEVDLCCENEFLQQGETHHQHFFTMARQLSIVKKLQAMEQEGRVVVNSGFGIENCYRTNLHRTLTDHDIPVPPGFIVPTSYTDDAVFDQLPGKGFWIKRGDFHAIHKEDVTFVTSVAEGKEMLREYALRGIPDALISQHLVGDLVKFYGVRGTEFFFWFYPYDNQHHKYAEYEQINGKSLHHAFSETALKEVATAAAAAVQIDVYGGDAIVDKDGQFKIIDFNDWPSFAPCRQEAAEHIAALIFEKFLKDA